MLPPLPELSLRISTLSGLDVGFPLFDIEVGEKRCEVGSPFLTFMAETYVKGSVGIKVVNVPRLILGDYGSL